MGNWKNRDKRKLPWECNPLRKQWNQREQRHSRLFLHSIVGSDSSFFLTDQSLLKKALEFTQKSLRTLRRIRSASLDVSRPRRRWFWASTTKPKHDVVAVHYEALTFSKPMQSIHNAKITATWLVFIDGIVAKQKQREEKK